MKGFARAIHGKVFGKKLLKSAIVGMVIGYFARMVMLGDPWGNCTKAVGIGVSLWVALYLYPTSPTAFVLY